MTALRNVRMQKVWNSEHKETEEPFGQHDSLGRSGARRTVCFVDSTCQGEGKSMEKACFERQCQIWVCLMSLLVECEELPHRSVSAHRNISL